MFSPNFFCSIPSPWSNGHDLVLKLLFSVSFPPIPELSGSSLRGESLSVENHYTPWQLRREPACVVQRALVYAPRLTPLPDFLFSSQFFRTRPPVIYLFTGRFILYACLRPTSTVVTKVILPQNTDRSHGSGQHLPPSNFRLTDQ